MTAIYYPDCVATSPAGRYRFEARSPDNGTLTDDEVRRRTPQRGLATLYGGSFQSDFRYRLIENATGKVAWQRQQSRRQESPHELLVSDEGWTVTRIHGFAPQVVARTPAGRVAVHVHVLGPEEEDLGLAASAEHGRAPSNRRFVWRAEHLGETSAGSYWADHSCAYFFEPGGRPHFAWRTYWGQRLLLDLESGRVVDEAAPAAAHLLPDCDEREKAWARRRLEVLAPRAASVAADLARVAERDEDHDEWRRIYDEHLVHAKAAVQLAAVHNLSDCVPLLRALEPPEFGAGQTSSDALGRGYEREMQMLRPIVHHSLRRLGAQPQGYPTYRFRGRGRGTVPLAEPVPDPGPRLAALPRSAIAFEVLRLVGAPHHIAQRSRSRQRLRAGTQDWEYDVLTPAGWTTTLLVWQEPREHPDRPAELAAIETHPSDWLRNDERELDIMRD